MNCCNALKNENPKASDLQPFAVRAKLFFTGPDRDGKQAVIFETGERVRVKYSDNNGCVLATARPDDFWGI